MKKKRCFLCCLLGSMSLLLSSCTVNWFDKQYDVPWWAVAIPVILLCLIFLVAACKYFTSKKYICPACNRTFSPKWWQAALTIHINSDRVFKCPHCGKRSFCRLARSQND